MSAKPTTAEGPRSQWTDDLLTGDKEIDNQHKTFFAKAQRVFVASKLGRGANELDATLSFMEQYARIHFRDEEARMQAAAYPYVASHRAQHAEFLERLAKLRRDVDAADDKEAAAAETARVALDWFSRHIKGVDLPLVEFLRGDRGDLE